MVGCSEYMRNGEGIYAFVKEKEKNEKKKKKTKKKRKLTL